MTDSSANDFDVVIMGGGLAGQCQARHLLLNIPGVRVAVVEPRSREKMLRVDKIGESMVEIAALFVYKELGLYEYLVENHPPKNGLNFHWPREPQKTEGMSDYFSVWNNHNPPIASFQLHRGRFEADMHDMNGELGATQIRGKVMDFDLEPGEKLHTIRVRQSDKTERTLTARHLIDAAGRSYLTGSKTDNILKGPENLWGLENGAAWVRVKNVDRKHFACTYDPGNSATSHYYGTNHFFGHGHWAWMIPISTEDMSLSIGIMHHHDVIEGKSVSTLGKYKSFLRKNQTILANLVDSGEIVDFKYFSSVAHRCKRMFHEDKWYAIGDAAYFGDAFYSMGTTTIAFHVESVTELVRSDLARESDWEVKRSAFEDFNLWYSRMVMGLYRHHSKHLGHASIMSWRIYYEYIWWFGMNVPIYIGKWHLQPDFIRRMLANCELCFNNEIYEHMNELIDRGDANLGFMDCYRADQLAFGYHTPKHFELFLENGTYAPRALNIYKSIAGTYFYALLWYAKFMYLGFGLKGIFNKRTLYHLGRLSLQTVKSGLGAVQQWASRLFKSGSPDIVKMRKDFQRYRHQPQLEEWLPKSDSDTPSEDQRKAS